MPPPRECNRKKHCKLSAYSVALRTASRTWFYRLLIVIALFPQLIVFRLIFTNTAFLCYYSKSAVRVSSSTSTARVETTKQHKHSSNHNRQTITSTLNSTPPTTKLVYTSLSFSFLPLRRALARTPDVRGPSCCRPR